jgi:protease I
MKALILAADGFEDLEFYYPLYRLREHGVDVDVAAPLPGTITGKHGYTYEVKHAIGDMDPDAYDLLVIPGGRAPEAVRLVHDALDITRRMFESGKVVGSICHGIQVLISAGIVGGRSATCWKGVRDDLKAAGGKYFDRAVVVDGTLVTSRCPDDLPAFCCEIFRLLARSEELVSVDTLEGED